MAEHGGGRGGDVGDKAREEFFSEAQEIVDGLSRDLLALDDVAVAGLFRLVGLARAGILGLAGVFLLLLFLGGAGQRPNREGSHDRPRMAVLGEIDVDLALAGSDGASEGGKLGRGLDSEEGQKPGEGARALLVDALPLSALWIEVFKFLVDHEPVVENPILRRSISTIPCGIFFPF